jgi:hypothetical protein
MSDDDQVLEIARSPIAVAETSRIYRLSPAVDKPARTSRQIAIVAADTEDQARIFATNADPMGRDWNDRSQFPADYRDTPEQHVVGDVVFQSVPTPSDAKHKRLKKN